MLSSSIDLLEHLAQLSQCGYLSNLRFIHAPSAPLWQAVNATPPQLYPRQAWMDALHYLTGQTIPADTAQQCRQALLDYFAPHATK